MYTIEQYLLAAKNGSTSGIKDALNSGIDVNAVLEKESTMPGLEGIVPGTTALMLAAGGAQISAVKMLLNSLNASVKARNVKGETVFTAILTSKLEDDINNGSLDEIFELALRKLQRRNVFDCTKQDKTDYFTDMGIDPETSPLLVYAAERGLFRAVASLIALGIPHQNTHQGTVPTLDSKIHKYDPLHAAIVHDYPFVINLCLNGTYLHQKQEKRLKPKILELNLGTFTLALKYGSSETIFTIYDRLADAEKEDVDWFAAINTILDRRFLKASFGENVYRIARVADHMLAMDLTYRFIRQEQTVEAEEIFLKAAGAGAGSHFLKLMLDTYGCKIDCTDIFDNTPLMRAMTSTVGLPAVLSLVKSGADLKNLDRSVFSFNANIFYVSNQDKFFRGSVLTFAALNSIPLLKALLELDEEIYPNSMQQAQLEHVCDADGATLTQILLASPDMYEDAINLIKASGLSLELPESPRLQSQTGSPQRRFRLPSLSITAGCMQLPESSTSATIERPLSESSNSPTKAGFGPRMNAAFDLFRRTPSTTSTPDFNNGATPPVGESTTPVALETQTTGLEETIQTVATITISESPKKGRKGMQNTMTIS